MALSDIVQVTIDRQTQTVTREGFGILLIVGTATDARDRFKLYNRSELDNIGSAWGTSSDVYLAAQTAFAQNPSVSRIAVGRQTTDGTISADLSGVASLNDDGDISATVNGTTASYTKQASDTIDEAFAAFAAAMELALKNAGHQASVTYISDSGASDYQTIYFTLDDSIVVSAFTADDGTQDLSGNLSAASDERWADALDGIREISDSWYGLMITSKAEQDRLDVALWTETQKKIFGCSDNDSDTIGKSNSADSTTLLAQLKAKNYDRTFVLFHDTGSFSDEDFPEAAWFGRMFITDAGSATWAFKTLRAISADSLTENQKNNVLDKNGNIYVETAGVSITREGTMVGGEYIDIIRGVDWFEARLKERIYSKLVNLPKIPYTNAGITVIENEIRAQLETGIDQGVIAPTPPYTINVPDVADVSVSDRANRILPDVEFTARLAGAIHKVEIFGVVSP